jgi:ADP-ribosyl-[dinitrogen reductase] hydrolase
MKRGNRVLGGIFGLCIGDALGLPVEGAPRDFLKRAPVKDLGHYGGRLGIPPGWWSDDSSLTFCLAESLCPGFNISDIAERFLKWLYEGYWTPGGKAFGIGFTTLKALQRIKKGENTAKAGVMNIRTAMALSCVFFLWRSTSRVPLKKRGLLKSIVSPA